METKILRCLLLSAIFIPVSIAFAADPVTDYRETVYSSGDKSRAEMFIDINDEYLKTVTLVKFRHDEKGKDEEYEFEIPSTVEIDGEIYTMTKIGERAFCHGEDCVDNVAKVTLPESILEIGREAFFSNDGLKTFTVPSGIIEIPEKLCYDSNKLSTIYIGENVKRIGNDAFYLCEKLTEVYVAAKEPPVFDYVFIPNQVKTVYVPKGSLDLYMTTWKNNKELTNAEFKEYDGFGTPSGAEEITEEGIIVSSSNGTIRISGNYTNSKVSVYGISGQKIAECSDTDVVLSLPRGIYIVRTANSNIKIIN